MESTIR